MTIEFVGGSQDGAILEVHPEMNYRLRFALPQDGLAPLGSVLGLENAVTFEQYEYKGSDRKYHFIGYV